MQRWLDAAAGRTSAWRKLTLLIADLSHNHLKICLRWVTCTHFPSWKGNQICFLLHPQLEFRFLQIHFLLFSWYFFLFLLRVPPVSYYFLLWPYSMQFFPAAHCSNILLPSQTLFLISFSSSVIILFWFSTSSSHTWHSHLQSHAQEIIWFYQEPMANNAGNRFYMFKWDQSQFCEKKTWEQHYTSLIQWLELIWIIQLSGRPTLNHGKYTVTQPLGFSCNGCSVGRGIIALPQSLDHGNVPWLTWKVSLIIRQGMLMINLGRWDAGRER